MKISHDLIYTIIILKQTICIFYMMTTWDEYDRGIFLRKLYI